MAPKINNSVNRAISDEFLSLFPENVRRILGNNLTKGTGKMDKELINQLAALANSRRFANRGVGAINDLRLPQVAGGTLAGSGVGGVGGFLAAPGTDNENIMGKKSYKGPSLGDRLNYALSGALAGGGIGAGVGVKRLDDLAKLIAKGKDIPPGAVEEFLQGVSTNQRRNILSTAVAKQDPTVAAMLTSGAKIPKSKAGKTVAQGVADWTAGAPQRAAEVENNLRRLILRRKQLEENNIFKGPEHRAISALIDAAMGGAKNIDEIGNSDIANQAAYIAKHKKKDYNPTNYLLSEPGVESMLANIRRTGANAADEGAAGYEASLGKKTTAAGGITGATVGALAGLPLGPLGVIPGAILGGIGGSFGGNALTHSLSKGVANVVQKVNPAELPWYAETARDALNRMKIKNNIAGITGGKGKGANRTWGNVVQKSIMKDLNKGNNLFNPNLNITEKGRRYRNLILGTGAIGSGALGLTAYLNSLANVSKVPDHLTINDLGRSHKLAPTRTEDLNKRPINLNNPVLQHFNNKNYKDKYNVPLSSWAGEG